MKVTINDKQFSFDSKDSNISVQDMLNNLKIVVYQGIAVAINLKVISKNTWNKHLLNENDKIIIIKATQGG